MKTLPDSNQRSGAIVTHSLVTSDGCYVITAESERVQLWNVDSGRLINTCDCVPTITQLLMTGDNSKVGASQRQTKMELGKRTVGKHGQISFLFKN
jgi:hypothetical protein